MDWSSRSIRSPVSQDKTRGFFLLALQPPLGVVFYSPLVGFSLLAYEVSWSHTTTRHIRQDSSERMISPSQRPQPDNTQHSQQTNIHAPGGIRTHISAGERPKTYALDRAATGTGTKQELSMEKILIKL